METMNRQHAVIAMAKIGRLIKQLRYWIDADADSDLYFATFDEDISQSNEWADTVYKYLKKSSCKIVAEEFERIGLIDDIEEYVNNKNGRLDARLRPNLICFIKKIHKIEAVVRKIKAENKGEYPDLIPALANERTVELLQRAVDGGLLDEHYMPIETTTGSQLRVIAYAIATIMKFPNRCKYVYFEKQWNRASYRVGNIPLAQSEQGRVKHEYAMSLYPDVDFSSLLQVSSDNDTFYCPYPKQRIKRMYLDLVEGGYIAHYTTLDDFQGIFDANKFSKPVEWIKSQRQLSYFLTEAFTPTNKRLVWVKSCCCFRIFGKVPHKDAMVTGLGELKRKGVYDTYDPELKDIARRYNAK